MKKLFQYLGVVIVFSVIFLGCRKEPEKNTMLFTPYAEVINPPDSFVYYIPLAYSAMLQGKIQFKEDAVWHITKTLGTGASTWLARTDQTSIFGIDQDDTVALQGNIPYLLTANNTNSPEGVKIYLIFTKISRDYQSFNPKY